MGISLAKGERISLEKVSPGLTEAVVGLGWDLNPTDSGQDFDLDGSLFILGSDERLISDKHFIFYNNLTSPDTNKSIRHMGCALLSAVKIQRLCLASQYANDLQRHQLAPLKLHLITRPPAVPNHLNSHFREVIQDNLYVIQ